MSISVLGLCALLSVAAASASSPADELSDLAVPQLQARLATSRGVERGLVHLYLAGAGSPSGASADSAFHVLDSLFAAQPIPLHAAWLGTAEALMARQSQGNGMQASQWVRRSIAHLDSAVSSNPKDPVVRAMRLGTFANFPSLFEVDDRLKEDDAFLRAAMPMERQDASVLMALASAAKRAGSLSVAQALWKQVMSKSDASEKWKQRAQRFLTTDER